MPFLVTRKEFQEALGRIEELETRLAELENRLAELEAEYKGFLESPAVRELLSLCREV